MFRRTTLSLLLLASLPVCAAGAPTDPAKGKAIAETVCVACHAADGNGLAATPNQPKLAAQGEAYLLKQLQNFKPANGKPALRKNDIMAGMTANLSEDDMRNLAGWFTRQKQQPAVARNLELVAQGEKLWRRGDVKKGIPACAGCHGPAGAGVTAQYPRLGGQFPEYLEAQLKAFRQGDRSNDPESMMRMTATKMTDSEIKAVAEYAAGLR